MKTKHIIMIFFLLIAVTGCLTTTGEIQGNHFLVSKDFQIDLLDSEWEPVRQQVFTDIGIRRENMPSEIVFRHKKSNGVIGVNSMELDTVAQERPLEVHAENALVNHGEMKLSEKVLTVAGFDAIELVISGKYMTKYIFLKSGQKGYEIYYKNTPTYFDQYLDAFDRFVQTFVLL